MKERYTGWTAGRTALAAMTLLITYFSVVSTFTNGRVSGIEEKTDEYSEKAAETERNIAVILEKIRNIESMLLMIREEISVTGGRPRNRNGRRRLRACSAGAWTCSQDRTGKVTHGNSKRDTG